jgi:ubiquinone/menaquinone biosynthesis C-methylase UbiE
MLSRRQARDFYDRLGSKQDWQRFYEDPAVADLIAHLSLGAATSVIEFGCGTGRMAESLLAHHLPSEATYSGIEISSTMARLAKRRLARFGTKARVVLTKGEIQLDVKASSFDRFLSTYVLDLLTEDDIRSLVAEAHRVLVPSGLLGVVSLTHGFTPLSRVFERAWMSIFRVRPGLVGGCRPISLEDFIHAGWNIRHSEKTTSFGVPSEVLVAEKG